MTIGIDEVGRGCWAGPLVAAAVGLGREHDIVGLNDSKKLSAKKRLLLTRDIQAKANLIGVGWVWPSEINKIGLTESVRLAMQRAFDEIGSGANGYEVIIDGNINYLSHIENTGPIVGADGLIDAVSAASIIAKVARDAYMTKISEKYPEFGFDSHVGYGTKRHIEALELHGISPLHRTNYKPIKRYL